MPFVLDWKGDDIRRKVAAAAIVGVDATLARAVDLAKADHPSYPPASQAGERYASRVGFAVASTTIKAPAVLVGAHVRGTWGADADYSLFLEIGTSRKDSGEPRADVRAAEGDGNMWAIPGPSSSPQMAARYTLRPAAAEANSLLAVRIGLAYRGEAMV
jgi:hypothetical protein